MVDLLAALFMGFGLIVWLLETERNRARRADDELRLVRDFDPVTGLINRRRLLQELPAWLAHPRQPLALLMLRLDQLGSLSTTIGMVAAESLMADAAARLERQVQAHWMRPARISDTHLVQLIPSDNTSELSTFASSLLAAMRLPFPLAGNELSLSASIGIALAPTDADEAEALIAAAESACTSARAAGGNRFHYYSAARNKDALLRLSLQTELRRAMAKGEPELYFQPMVAGCGHQICAAEGLVRWHHPERGTLVPEMFVDGFEQLGLSEELDQLMIEQACREARLWYEQHGSEITVAVNVSAHSFHCSGFSDMIRRILEQTGLPPERLELEIVESSAMVSLQQAILTLHALRELGVRTALDDFGTGYSPLAHLRELPVDCLKIDRSFVNNVLTSQRDAAIVKATITLAHSLGLEVVVEGVETSAQMEWFAHRDADRMQGYLFSAPVPRERMRQLLGSREQWLAHAAH